MAESFLSKAGALILSGAALLGIAYGGAKYVAEFESAKSEIQNLRGQVTQLRDLLDDARSGVGPERIERLEREVAELKAAVQKAAPEPSPPEPAVTPVSIAERLATGSFGGTATDGASVWPFRATNVSIEGSRFEADLEWVTLNATHRARGEFSDRRLFFKEVEVIKAGNNVIGCEYTLETVRADGLSGTYQNCADGVTGGTIEVKW